MIKRITLLCLTLIMLLTCMAGCGKSYTTWSLEIDGELVPVETLLKVDSTDVSLFEYRFYFASMKAKADNGDDSYWIGNDDAKEKLVKDTLDAICYDIAKERLMESLNIGLSRKEKREVKQFIREYKSDYTDEQWKKLLADSYMDEAFYEELNYRSKYDSVIQDYYFSEATGTPLKLSDVLSYMQENYYHYKYIYVKYDYDGTQTNKEMIQTVLDKINKGEEFEKLMQAYSRDYTADTAKIGTYILKVGVSPVVDAVSALEEGQTSSIIEADNGYYIYKRYDINVEDARQSLDEFKSLCMSDFIAEKINEIVKNFKIEYVSDLYDKITIESLLHD